MLMKTYKIVSCLIFSVLDFLKKSYTNTAVQDLLLPYPDPDPTLGIDFLIQVNGESIVDT